ncbi:DUOXA-like protein C06E1.3 [Trichinella pseudospiralis]|uniref:DUOXA-like protein C06E1.3 n=2 Tax=Trichinella pseudospiralis TaxID=6337 RepID=A0A0V1EN10_TRIPS|nr:DUOXA-like protein C06E1.3 [Trichinella pseudospiralis]
MERLRTFPLKWACQQHSRFRRWRWRQAERKRAFGKVQTEVGWFNAFRDNGGPTFYGDHRTSVLIDFTTAKIAVVFSIFFITFLIIFPGIRRRKLASFLSVILTLFVGASILLVHFYPCWHEAEVTLFSPYRAFTAERFFGVLGVKIGLSHANITLIGESDQKSKDYMNYNERIHFTDVRTMQQNLVESLHKGLPYPIITVTEYFAMEKAGFIWGRGYRLAGYYTDFILWISFSLWCVLMLVMCMLPRYFSRILSLLGCCLLISNAVYAMACPKHLTIPFPNTLEMHSHLMFRFGWCFWLILATGGSCLTIGVSIRLIERFSSCKFKTFLQLDYEEMSISTIDTDVSNASPHTPILFAKLDPVQKGAFTKNAPISNFHRPAADKNQLEKWKSDLQVHCENCTCSERSDTGKEISLDIETEPQKILSTQRISCELSAL